MFLMVLLMLVPWLLLLPLLGFFLLTAFGFLQAFIFSILTYVYIVGSVMMEHDEH